MTIVRCKSLGEFQRALKRDMKRKDKDIQEAVRQTAIRGAALVRKEAPEADGDLRRSIDAKHGPKTSVIAVDSPIAKYVLRGTRPHFPPIAPIVAWLERRGIATGKEAEKIAWAIALRMAERGTRPNPFIQRAMPLINVVMRLYLDRALRKT